MYRTRSRWAPRRMLELVRLERRDVPAGSWLASGPSPITGGQTEGLTAQNNPVSGAVNALLASPTDADVMYVGTVNGGVWKTTNATATSPTWVPLTDYLPSLSILELVYDPSDPTQNTVLAGIGRTSSYGSDGGLLQGILRSTDGGTSWTQLGTATLTSSVNGVEARGGAIVVTTNNSTNGLYRSTDVGKTFTVVSGTGGLPTGRGYDLVSDPANPLRLYGAVAGGIYRSDDFGLNWTNVTPPNSLISASSSNVKLSIHSFGSANVVYAGVINSGRITGLFRSANAGASWQSMDIPEIIETTTDPITDASNTTPIVITSPGHGRSNNNRVFIDGVTGNTAANGTWTVTVIDTNTFSLNNSAGNGTYTGGGTWQAVTGLQPTPDPARDEARAKRNVYYLPTEEEAAAASQIHDGDDVPGGQGGIHFSLIASPTNPNLVYIGGDRQPLGGEVNGGANAVGAQNYSGRLFRGDASQPSGSQWTPITNKYAHPTGSIPGTSPHADSRDLAFDVLGNLIEADDGGIYKRSSPELSTGIWSGLHGNLQNNEIYPGGVAYDTLNNIFTAGAQDTGSFQQSSSGSLSWATVNQGDGGVAGAAVLPGGTQSVRYASSQNLGGFRRRIYNSSNGQVSSVAVGLDVTGGGGTTGDVREVDSALFVTPYEINTQDPERMVFGLANYFYESLDRGETLTRLNWGTANGGTTRGLAYGGPGNADLIWASGNNLSTELMVRTTGAGSLTLVSTYPGRYTRDIAIDPVDWQTAYFTDLDGRVWKTTDAGATAGGWTELTGNLLSLTTTSVRQVAIVPGFVVVGTQTGVFGMRATSPGTWFRLGGGMPTVPVHDVRYDAADDLLYVGTLGRGVWRFESASTSLAETTAPTGAYTGLVSVPTLPVDTIAITFTEPVNGLELSDFVLKRGVTTLSLSTAVQTLRTTDYITWTIGGLAPLTATAGSYTIDLAAGVTSGVFDGAGNALSNAPSGAWTFALDVPFVTSVSSSTPNGTYLPNVMIDVTVAFSEPVTVTGTPTLQLSLGAPLAFAAYSAGSGTSSLTFTYTLQPGQQTLDLEYVSSIALSLAGGTIRDASSQDAQLLLPSPGQTGSLSANKAIVVRPRSVVTGHTPTAKAGTSLSTFDVLFGQTMDTTSFSFAQDMVSFTGPGGDLSGAVSSFSWPNSTTLRINFAAQTVAGVYHFVLGPQVLTASGANPLDQDADNNFGEPVDDRYSATIALTVLHVNNSGDLDDGSYGPGQMTLREAVNLANASPGADTITFDSALFVPGGPVITLGSSLTLSDPVSIQGLGASAVKISGGNAVRLFSIDKTGSSGNAFSLNGMTLTEGYSGLGNHGGAIFNNDESLTLDSCVIENNAAVLTGGAIRLQTSSASLSLASSIVRNNQVPAGAGNDTGDGGAISVRSNSTVNVQSSTLSGNTASDDGGAIYFYSGGTLNVTNSTLSGNTAKAGDGGALYLWTTTANFTNTTIANNSAARGGGLAAFSSSKATMLHSTFAFNAAATAGGGLFNSGSSTLTLTNSLVGKNTQPASPDVSGAATANTSVVGSTTGATITNVGSFLNVDPEVLALADNGGPTQTVAIKAISPAKDSAAASAVTTDQRGKLRSGGPDIGAFELQPPPTVVSVVFGDGTIQRSIIKQIVVTFSEPVSFSGAVADAFSLFRSGTGGSTGNVALTANPPIGPAASVTLTFSGSFAEASGSLTDGLYDFKIDAAQVAVDQILDGDTNGSAGGDYAVTGSTAGPKFFRLFGDVNGDGFTDNVDLVAFRTANGSDTTMLSYNAAFDVNGDGFIDNVDFIAFRQRLGVIV